MDKIEELLNLSEACRLLKVHPNTLRNWTREGKLEVVRIGERKDRRFRTKDIISLMNTENIEQECPPHSNSYEITYTGKSLYQDIIGKTSPSKIKLTKIYQGSQGNNYSNSLYYGDNFGILKNLLLDEKANNKVKLVYIDPPYSTNQKFKNKSEAHAYDDLLTGANYIEFIRERLIMLREILADDGSIYVHLDHNMSFPIKLIMDEVFGEKNFRSWITRKKCNPKNFTSKQYGNIQDFILFYTKSSKYTWNRPYESQGIYSFEQRYPKIDKVTGRRYALVPIHAKGIRNGATGETWKGMKPPFGKHWQFTPEKLEDLDMQGRIYWSPTGNPRRKIYADEDKGVPVQDIWLNYKDAHNQNIKVTGYPTEKNPDLLSRIIKTSSNEGDIVLDCFCGSGTTLAVAEETNRKWIGIDNSELAIKTTIKRLSKLCENRKENLRKRNIGLFEEHNHLVESEPFALFTSSELSILLD